MAALSAPEAADLSVVRARIGAIPDPEIPVVSLSELGILRDVQLDSTGRLIVTLTPTYSGCPATEVISADVKTLLARLGYPDALVQIALAPAWTTDWISPTARDKLRAYGIAPPGSSCASEPTEQTHVLRFVRQTAQAAQPACPRCSSEQTERLSEFGSTPCKSLYRCLACREPFDYFKPY